MLRNMVKSVNPFLFTLAFSMYFSVLAFLFEYRLLCIVLKFERSRWKLVSDKMSSSRDISSSIHGESKWHSKMYNHLQLCFAIFCNYKSHDL